MAAADTIEVRIRPLSDGLPLPRKVVFWAFMAVVALIGFVLSAFTVVDFLTPSGLRVVQLVRRSTGEIVIAGEAPPFRSKPLAMVIRRDAERFDEAALLEKWGDPRTWRRLLDHERY